MPGATCRLPPSPKPLNKYAVLDQRVRRVMPSVQSAIHTPYTTPALGVRLASFLYEGVLLFSVAFIAGYLFSTLSQSRHALENRHPLQAFLFIIFGIYFTWSWSKGQTLAMKTWRIRVLDHTGQPPSQARALLRYLTSWLWFLPPLALGEVAQLPAGEIAVITLGWILVWALLSRFHPSGQFWHDALAGTRLVSTRPSSE